MVTVMFEDKVQLLMNLQVTYTKTLQKFLPPSTSNNIKMKRQSFLTNKVTNFLDRCATLLPFITDKDLTTLGTPLPSKRIKELYLLLAFLRDNGFETTEDIPLDMVFWSGSIAKEVVKRRPDLCSDMDVPALCALFAISSACHEQLGQFDAFNLHLGNIISKLYASRVTGIAHLFISSNKRSELPGLESVNHFWHAELGQLHLSQQQGRVSDIFIHCYNHHKEQWLKPLRLSSETDRQKLLIRRREFHPTLDRPDKKGCFKSFDKSDETRAAWEASEPRPSISYERLLFFAKKFKENTLIKTMSPSI